MTGFSPPHRHAADAIVHHRHQLNLPQFVRQHFNYGRGADFLHRSRARYTGAPIRPKLEPLSFYVDLLRFPLRNGVSMRSLPLMCLMAISQIAYGFGYFRERLSRGRS